MIDATMTKRMEEATRLTRAGKLHEAMALLQGAVPEARGEDARKQPSWGGNTFEGNWKVVDEDIVQSNQRDESAEYATSSTFDEAQPSPSGVFSNSDIRVPAAWRDKWMKFRGGMARHEQAPPEYARSEVPLPGAFTAGRFTNHVGTRDYKLYIPSGYHGQALPLVVMLHGCTQNPDDFAAGTEMNRLAEEQQCCVLYPAQPTTANHSKCWNWFKAEDQQREGGEPAILAGMTQEVIDTHGLDASRTYVAGLSAGAAMATTLAMTYPDLFAAVGVHSGLPHGVAQSLPDALGAMQGGTGPLGGGKVKGAGWASEVPAIIFHGDRDTTVHPSNADRVASQYSTSRQTGATVEKGKVVNGHAYTRTMHHNEKGKPHMEQWHIHGAGHAWSGGSTKGSYTDPKGPDATKEMLRFFFQHQQGGA
ncbi:PHB depolymerase family esterase [Halovibrio sp. HP20-50]|uniref:extracellular catalytic domain type 1 short-chain-length polyhydroxyalkanoate depolymerase n=1 Tax=Halovibrio sp. HP20-59 TaxID=3080275 RepID=UPI00294B77BA|nr:PHB depolymerase family esterase [Halovibrio sp. HP20-59]MEA2118146.1 PHB depolymerase family esterase [Halovibrio sp. HP20-59]